MTVRRERRRLRAILPLLVLALAAGPATGAQGRAETECDLPDADSGGIELELTPAPPSDDSAVTVSGAYRHTDPANFPAAAPTVTDLRVELRECVNGRAPEPLRLARGNRSGVFDVDFELPYNGRYVVVVTATGSDGDKRTVSGLQDVVVPARPPTEVVASIDDAGTVELTWTVVDPDVDLLGFEVLRAPAGDRGFPDAGVVIQDRSVRRATDTPPPGTWKYSVRALRPGATEPDGAAGDYVRSSDVPSDPITRAAPVAETTTTTEAAAPAGAGSTVRPTSSSSTPSTRPAVAAGSRGTVDLSGPLNAGRPPISSVRRSEPDTGFR
ncbi:MAG TPA: hypothetical protein VM933_05810, partial [Acidimicrobiales bacterium]|nr:hypothetical protein [Acidimicrobiales bacterium]